METHEETPLRNTLRLDQAELCRCDDYMAGVRRLSNTCERDRIGATGWCGGGAPGAHEQRSTCGPPREPGYFQDTA